MEIKKLNLKQLENLYKNSECVNFGITINSSVGNLSITGTVDLEIDNDGIDFMLNDKNISAHWEYKKTEFNIEFYNKNEIFPPTRTANLNVLGKNNEMVNIQFVLKEEAK